MRILHVTSALVGGGAETQLKLLMRGLADRGHPVGAVFLKDDPDFTQRAGIDCIRIDRGPKWNLPGLHKRIAAAIDAWQPDIVHAWLPEIMTIPAALHCRRQGIPCVSAQRRSLRHVLSLRSRLRDWLILIPHLLSHQVACNFAFEREPALLRAVIQRRNGAVIRNGLAITQEPPAAAPEWLRPEAFKILYVGRLVEQKRVDLLVQAVAQLRAEGLDAQLVLCGTGDAEPNLRELANAKTLRLDTDIHFLGYQPRWKALAPHMDLFVLPSVAEGMPNVLVEAMGLGLPTVATDIYEINSFVTNGKESLLAKPNDLESLRAGIATLARDAKTRESIAQQGSTLAKRMSVEHMVNAYETLYMNLLNK